MPYSRLSRRSSAHVSASLFSISPFSGSASPRLHSQYLHSLAPCLRVSLTPCLYISVSLYLYSASLYLYVSISVCLCVSVSLLRVSISPWRFECGPNWNFHFCSKQDRDTGTQIKSRFNS